MYTFKKSNSVIKELELKNGIFVCDKKPNLAFLSEKSTTFKPETTPNSLTTGLDMKHIPIIQKFYQTDQKNPKKKNLLFSRKSVARVSPNYSYFRSNTDTAKRSIFEVPGTFEINLKSILNINGFYQKINRKPASNGTGLYRGKETYSIRQAFNLEKIDDNTLKPLENYLNLIKAKVYDIKFFKNSLFLIVKFEEFQYSLIEFSTDKESLDPIKIT